MQWSSVQKQPLENRSRWCLVNYNCLKDEKEPTPHELNQKPARNEVEGSSEAHS